MTTDLVTDFGETKVVVVCHKLTLIDSYLNHHRGSEHHIHRLQPSNDLCPAFPDVRVFASRPGCPDPAAWVPIPNIPAIINDVLQAHEIGGFTLKTQSIKSFPPTLRIGRGNLKVHHSPVILKLCFRKTRSGSRISHDFSSYVFVTDYCGR